MIIKETKLIQDTIPVLVKCDCCGNETAYEYQRINNMLGWHHFSSGHYEWGNDSCDSVETFDVCSSECYWITVKEQLETFSDDEKDTAYIDNMNWKFAKELSEGIEL